MPEALAERADIEVGETLSLGVRAARRTICVSPASSPTRSRRGPTEGALLMSSADAREQFGATTASLWIMVPQADVAPTALRRRPCARRPTDSRRSR